MPFCSIDTALSFVIRQKRFDTEVIVITLKEVSFGRYQFSQALVGKTILWDGWIVDKYGSKDNNKTKQSCILLIYLSKL